jgi:hypothetical protein
VRIFISGGLDRTGEAERFVRIVFAPAVVRESGRGDEKDDGCPCEDVLSVAHAAMLHPGRSCSRLAPAPMM